MSLFDQNLNVFRAMKPNYTNKRMGKLGKYNDDGTVNSDVSYGLTLDYSWVRFSEDRAATRVKNLAVRREWGTPVWVEYNELTREDEVREVHGILAPAVYGGEIAAALNNPGVPTSVSTPVSANDVMPGRVVVVTNAALTVRVYATWTPHGDYWDGSTLITITPTATSSKRSFACVGITSAGASVVTLTTDRALSYAFTDGEGALTLGAADIKTVMDAAPTTWWVGAILLSNGDTTIDPARIYDLRFWRKLSATFTAAGDSGSSQTVSEGDTLTIAGGVGLASVASATDTITLNLDVNSLTADASPDSAADYVATWDASASTHKKVLLSALGGAGYYQTVRNSGSAQTQRAALNFLPGTNITFGFADDAGNNETEFTINSSATPGGGAAPSICEGRLTLTSGTAVTVTDVTAAGTLYFTPYGGDYIGLYSGSAWELKTFSELSISLSGLLPHSIHDVYAYNNSGTPTLELTAWTAGATGTITGATNATPIVITSTAHGLTTADIVTISGVGGNTAANGTFRITNTGADTFSLQSMAAQANVAGSGAYTSGGTWYKANYAGTRATALTTQDSIYVKTGATTRRYLGTIRITATAGECEDSLLKRFVIGIVNPQIRTMRAVDATNSWTVSGATLRAMNNSLLNRVEFVAPLPETFVFAATYGLGANSTSGSYFNSGVGIDSATATSAQIILGSSMNQYSAQIAEYRGYPGTGYHFAQALETGAAAGTTTWLGDSGAPTLVQSGMQGFIWG